MPAEEGGKMMLERKILLAHLLPLGSEALFSGRLMRLDGIPYLLALTRDLRVTASRFSGNIDLLQATHAE